VRHLGFMHCVVEAGFQLKLNHRYVGDVRCQLAATAQKIEARIASHCAVAFAVSK
jgi:hypothetical protein